MAVTMKQRKALVDAVVNRVVPHVEALLFPPTLHDLEQAMTDGRGGVDVVVLDDGKLMVESIAQTSVDAWRNLHGGLREVDIRARRLGLPLVTVLKPAVARYAESEVYDDEGTEYVACASFRLAESACWPGSIPGGWTAVPGPVIEKREAEDRGRVVYRGHSTRPYMLYVYPGNSTYPESMQAFNESADATAAYGPILRRLKEQARAAEARRRIRVSRRR